MKAGTQVIAIKDMVVRDIEDSSLPPLYIKKGDKGVIKGYGDYDNGRAIEIIINGDEIFIYPRAFSRCFETVEVEVDG